MNTRFTQFPLLMAVIIGVSGMLGCQKQEAKSPAASTIASSVPETTAAKKIVVGVDEEFPPIVFRDGDGKLIGHDIDLARETFKRMGITMEHRAVHWGSKDDELIQKKTIDMLWSGVNISEARKQVYAFSTPYLDNFQVVVVPTNSPIRSLADLSGKIVGVQQGTSTLPRLQAFQGKSGPIGKIETFPEYAKILVAMMEGKIEAAVMGDVALPSYMQNSPGKFRVVDGNFGETSMAVALRKQDTELLEKINQALASLKADGTAQSIRARWFPKNQ